MGQKSLKSFNVKFFRGIRDLSLESLGQINLLVGVNNSGKTSVLEALSIYCHPLDIGVWLNTAQQREQEFRIARTPPLNSLQWLFTHDRTIATYEQKTGSIYITSSGSYTVKTMRARYEAIEGMSIAEGHQLPMAFDGRADGSDNEQMNEGVDFSEVQKGLDLIIELEDGRLC